jgi:peptide/nickel transport system permease protein
MTTIAEPASEARRRIRLFRYPGLTVGGAIAATVVGATLLSLVWTPYSPLTMNMRQRFQGPSLAHVFGTDQFGRDVLSLLMVGAQNSLAVGIVAVTIGLAVGTALGLFAAARRGWVDEAVMRVCDFLFAFPAVLSAVMLAAALGPGTGNAMLAIGFYNIPIFARIARGAAKGVWVREFIYAARTAGKGAIRISLEHVLPNILNIIVVQATISFATAILAEAALSYLGLGTQPPAPSWGRMLHESQVFLSRAPYLSIFPGLIIVLTVLGLNLLGDGMRDALDPRHAQGR